MEVKRIDQTETVSLETLNVGDCFTCVEDKDSIWMLTNGNDNEDCLVCEPYEDELLCTNLSNNTNAGHIKGFNPKTEVVKVNFILVEVK